MRFFVSCPCAVLVVLLIGAAPTVLAAKDKKKPKPVQVEPEDQAPDDAAAGESGDSSVRGLQAVPEGPLRRSGRMEFDERLVKGQAAKSGAVYLFKRVPRRLPGLVPMRRSYRQRIVQPILGRRVLKPAVYSDRKKTATALPAEKTEPLAAEETKTPEPVVADQNQSKRPAKTKTKSKSKSKKAGRRRGGK
jgi:hypothetical protein